MMASCAYCSADVIPVEEADFLYDDSASGLGLPDVSTLKVVHASEMSSKSPSRLRTGIGEFDNILGGGIVPGEVILFAGTPGAGKSTMLAIVSQSLADKGRRVLYLSGEESEDQVSRRHMRVHADSDLIDILSSGKAKDALSMILSGQYSLVVVDSIQTIKGDGSMMDIAYSICEAAHSSGTPVIMVGHFTKNSEVGGPMTLIHAVDAVFTLSPFGDEGLRILRAEKNRFADTSVTACFRHVDDGFEEVPDPSGLLDSRESESVVGIGPTILMEGTKNVLAEVQAMVTTPLGGNTQFVSQGLPTAKARVVLAALSHKGVDAAAKDVYVSLGGGIKTSDSGIDLGIAAALTSAVTDVPVSARDAFVGEILLTGELRAARGARERQNTAERLGMRTVGPNCDVDVRTVSDLVSFIVRRDR